MKAVTAVRVLALVSVALALMCAALAWAWSSEHEKAACWRAAVEYKLETDSKCDG
jgi:hypothetical protein